jgi:hypothetical protein
MQKKKKKRNYVLLPENKKGRGGDLHKRFFRKDNFPSRKYRTPDSAKTPTQTDINKEILESVINVTFNQWGNFWTTPFEN